MCTTEEKVFMLNTANYQRKHDLIFPLKLMMQRAQFGDMEAQFELGKFLISQGKIKRAICFLEYASIRGHLDAEKILHDLTQSIEEK